MPLLAATTSTSGDLALNLFSLAIAFTAFGFWLEMGLFSMLYHLPTPRPWPAWGLASFSLVFGLYIITTILHLP